MNGEALLPRGVCDPRGVRDGRHEVNVGCRVDLGEHAEGGADIHDATPAAQAAPRASHGARMALSASAFSSASISRGLRTGRAPTDEAVQFFIPSESEPILGVHHESPSGFECALIRRADVRLKTAALQAKVAAWPSTISAPR